MYSFADVRGVHLEMTTGCNARCPMCPRNHEGGRVAEELPAAELTAEDVRRIFPEEFVGRLSWLYMCGNYGDALVARDTLKAFEYFRAANKTTALRLITNGSGRDADWWRGLARAGVKCTFSIDGLEDTNHLYRRGTSWPKILSSIAEFVGAGGDAEWDFLVFRHNEHQIEAALALSRTLGFGRFNVKKTARFFRDGAASESQPVRGVDGRIEYELELPRDPANRNAAYAEFSGVSASADYAAYLASTPVNCKVQRDGEIFVSAAGHAFPCAWTGKLYNNPQGNSRRLIERLPDGLASLDARRHSLQSVVDGPFFQSLIPASWELDGAGRKENPVCAQKCGAWDLFRSQIPAPS